VVQPSFAIPPLSLYQQIKLRVFQLPPPKNIGPIFSKAKTEIQNKILKQLDLEKNQFFLFNAGSGGHKTKNILATDYYHQAAKKFHKKTGVTCVMLFGPNYPNQLPSSTDAIRTISSMDNDEFIALLDAAKGLVISSGDTLLQTLELKKPSVAAAVSKDQPKRLENCNQRNIVIKARLDANDLANQAEKLLDEKVYQSILQQMQRLQPLSAIDIVLTDIQKLLNLSG
jgi:UDP-N-acetylglucosamine 2-epimerase